MKKYLIITILFSSMILFANDRPGLVFLSISPGASAVGMGSAFTGLCDDPSLLYYNPGGLGLYDRFGFLVMNQGLPSGLGRLIEENLLSLMGSAFYRNDSITPEPVWLPGLWPDMHYIYSALILPKMKIGNFGLSFTYLNTGTTDVYNHEGTYLGSYESYDYAAGLSYGNKLYGRIGFGLSAKYIYSFLVPQWVWDMMPELGIDEGGTVRSFAVDCGLLYKIWDCGIGLSVLNLGPRIKYTASSTADRPPTRIRWGIAINPVVVLDSTMLQFKDNSLPFPLSSIFDFKFAYDVSYDPQIAEDTWKSKGYKLTFFKIFFYRCGDFKDFSGARVGSTGGFGFNLRNIQIDIATDEDIYNFASENWRVQIILNAIEPPNKIKNEEKLNRLLTVTSGLLAPGGGQFYKGEGIKGAIFFAPGLYLGNLYFNSDSNNKKAYSLIGLGILYSASLVEALLK